MYFATAATAFQCSDCGRGGKVLLIFQFEIPIHSKCAAKLSTYSPSHCLHMRLSEMAIH